MAVMVVPTAWVEVVARLVSAALLPTVLLKVMLPEPAVMVSAYAPLTAPPNDTALLDVVNVEFAPKVTTPV